MSRSIQWIWLVGVMLFSSVAIGIEVESFTNPYREIKISASEPGIITEIPVKEGDRVEAGQMIGQLDDQVLLASRRIARAAMDATGKLQTARSDLSMQSRRVEKLTTLRARGHATQQEVDLAISQKEMALARVQTVLDELAVKKHEWNRISVQIEQRKLKSPIKGIVNRLHIDVGELVSMQEPLVATIVQLDPLLAIFSVPQREAASLHVDQKVNLLIGEESVAHVAVVEFVSPTTNAETGTTQVKVRVDNPENKIQSGTQCVLLINSDGLATRKKRKFNTRNVSSQTVR